jgi:hypothetical protein
MVEKQAWKMNGFMALLLSLLVTLFGAGYAFFSSTDFIFGYLAERYFSF